MKRIVFSGANYNRKNLDQATQLIDDNKLNLTLEDDFDNERMFVVGSEEEINTLFQKGREANK